MHLKPIKTILKTNKNNVQNPISKTYTPTLLNKVSGDYEVVSSNHSMAFSRPTKVQPITIQGQCFQFQANILKRVLCILRNDSICLNDSFMNTDLVTEALCYFRSYLLSVCLRIITTSM